ncbi:MULTISPECIES: hypothetical protein [unclassified Arcicella]|uniref:hypothetical protein n=1 Tax=unclassified Arcicella TaxID=2644986 RepID=UPI00285C843D|nr:MULTISPECIES: hypothetical protein [unclassified Arcicella]MDR6562558.1 lipopolysaccharide export LptBFGC system permease protein LptF [Arcicella sp. BE51]MDR6812645.1 lipopolysaccharide export LptBFGC system permease protein LptF [Arcicella sp. BE140]MDR6823957.1 lipopolysaccharide export LptBFGC system permease protein LptF [Arcicella sp. BE139]
MKKSAIIISLICFVFSLNVKAQAQDEPLKGKEKIKAAKVGLITNRLNLTEDQAKGFWVVYNEFDTKRWEIRKSIRQITAESRNTTSSEDKILSDLKEILNLKQKDVDLEKEYMSKFLKVINVRQVSELYKTEQLFNAMLFNRLNKGEGKMHKEKQP